ncbi:MAG TPA: hypothetical protein VGB00_20030 [Pyrinomonadaceae bacterium]|jgi:hypothetical protein
MKLILFNVLITLTLANAAYAQNTPDFCRVTTSTWSISEKLGTGIYVLGEFRPTAFDETTNKSFKHKDSNLTIDVAVEYGDLRSAEKGKPTEIQLTLDVFNKEQNTYGSADGSVEAKTSYGKRWGKISVEKRVTIGDLIYTFGLSCNDGSKIRKDSILY